jgi:hypothetical protein
MILKWSMERGFRRLTALLSILILLPSLLYAVHYGISEHPPIHLFLGAVLLAVSAATLPWLLFFIIRWLVRGFVEGS